MNVVPCNIGGSSFRGRIGIAREEITPPVGIYARNWGAARHDVAEGIHRPLTLTCATFQSNADESPLVLIGADLMSWRSRTDEWSVRGAILEALKLDESRVMFCFSHTHSAPSVQRYNASKPGGHLIGPYLEELRDRTIAAAKSALAQAREATLTWRHGQCDLATNRDCVDPNGERFICGFNPSGAADNTLLVGRVSDEAGRTIGTIVNYACHPTTLAWENRLISPDYVGAMRELVESDTDAPCLFIQGASGELAPAEQYAGDTLVADRHGRRLGFAVMSVLEGMLKPGAQLAYQGVVESGAPLAIWREEQSPVSEALAAERVLVELPLKADLPSVRELDSQLAGCNDPVQTERLVRKRAIRNIVGDGAVSEMPLWVWRLGNSFLVGQPNEAYSQFQTQLRAKFPDHALAVMNLVNGSAGYLPPKPVYDLDIYQVNQSPFAAGSLEWLIETAECCLKRMKEIG